MVKNEAHVIEETLQPFVDAGIDHFLVFDTGSEDKTVDIALSYADIDIDQTVARTVIPVNEKVVNGNMSLTTNWDDIGSPTLNQRSGAPYKSTSYSRYVEDGSTVDGTQSDSIRVIKGKTYRVMAWVYNTVNHAVMSALAPLAFSTSSSGNAAWELLQADVVATDDGLINIRFLAPRCHRIFPSPAHTDTA